MAGLHLLDTTNMDPAGARENHFEPGSDTATADSLGIPAENPLCFPEFLSDICR